MQLFVSLVICALLAVHGQPDNTSQQTCQVGRVCGVLENILRKQERLEKKVEEHSKILGGASCPEDGQKFSVSAVADCKTMIKSLPDNHYKLDTTTATQTDRMCRVLAQPTVESQAYSVSAELLNQAGWQGINSGHLGLLFQRCG
ncbi:hypothetical protein OS493_030311 [Desmophyllum pertusum]|uniref:Secreted protein n=1 Tax=Desmophyllum pertusum TaxID=174260 RepID=A0A9X0D363_9CNID|nr:hypothetical protein OS493_030311 [Desmophyllum pertusum]